MDRAPLYAQFDGDEIDGKVYGLGDEILDKVDAGTRTVLTGMGRIAASRPTVPYSQPIDAGKHIDDMTRPELEQSALAALASTMSEASDDDLRRAIEHARETAESRRNEAEDERKRQAAGNGAGTTSYDDLKDKPLGSLKTADLVTVAEAENVSIADASTNPERVKLIQAERDKKAA